MRTHALAILVGTGVVVGTFVATTDGTRQQTSGTKAAVASQPAQPAHEKPAHPQPARFGHLILQLEGNIHGLTVTWITPKTSGYNRTKVRSAFEIDLFDGAGAKLGTYPVDLSRFDTDPARVGKPLRVQGCEVLDSKIVTIVNVPYFEQTASMRIRNGGIVIGRLGAAQITKLMEQGEVR